MEKGEAEEKVKKEKRKEGDGAESDRTEGKGCGGNIVWRFNTTASVVSAVTH